MKHQKTLAAMSLIVGLVANSGTQASTYNLGLLTSTPTIQFVQITPGAFSDTFNFNIGTASDLAASASVHSLDFGSLSVLQISGLSMSIFGPSGQISGPTAPAISVTNFNLSTGSYYAQISGNATGLFGGSYSVAMVASPVPIPAAVWLLGSGLIGLVGVSRRKKQIQ